MTPPRITLITLGVADLPRARVVYAAPDDHVWEQAMTSFWPLAPDGSLCLPLAP